MTPRSPKHGWLLIASLAMVPALPSEAGADGEGRRRWIDFSTRSARRRPLVTKAVVLMGHADYGKDADKIILEGVATERAKGKHFRNHVIFGGGADKNRRKHNFLVDEVPIAVYSLVSLMRSEIKEAVVIGNADTKAIFEGFVKQFKSELKGKKWSFELEADKFSENIMLGKRALDPADEELTLVLTGDLPLFYNINRVINDRDIATHDIVFDMNSRERVGRHFPRNYHLRMDYKGKRYAVKEPNLFVANLGKIDPAILDLIFDSRRTYVKGQQHGSGESAKQGSRAFARLFRPFRGRKAGKGGGRWQVVKKLLISDGQWKKTLTVPGIGRLAWDALKRWLGENWDGLTVTSEQLERIAHVASGLRTKFKVENRDPGTLKDIDSLEDWSWVNAMFASLPADQKERIFPFYSDIDRFRRKVMPVLKQTVELYRDYPAYMNELFARLGLEHPYDEQDRLNHQYFFGSNPVKEDVRYHRGHRWLEWWRSLVPAPLVAAEGADAR